MLVMLRAYELYSAISNLGGSLQLLLRRAAPSVIGLPSAVAQQCSSVVPCVKA